MQTQTTRKLPIGAELLPEGVSFRVFASKCKKVEVCLEEAGKPTRFFELHPEGNGYFSGTFRDFSNHSLYRFRLDGAPNLYADPASRYQPEGPFGPSQIIDFHTYQWQEDDWHGVEIEGQVIYEMHIGTFTEEGTFAAAQKQLEELAALGITVLEIMPINEFPGKFGWGYDGVNLFAPTRLYGTPDDLRNFIAEAHRLHIAVILDVVYNHFGPDGNFIEHFSEEYLHSEDTDWGRGINFDNANTREFFLTNVRYWIEEYHFDGLRIDATQCISSTIDPPILKEICRVGKEATERHVLIIGENEPQKSIIIRNKENGGYHFDALWNDDFHHTAMVRLVGKREAYYTDYLGAPQEFISCIKYGFLYQGQHYLWQQKPRGTPCLDLKPTSYILFLQNHDQIANSGYGLRIHQLTDVGNLKAMTCLFIIVPSVPMLFQGQEFAASSPFFYFADHSDKLSRLVDYGRKESLSQFKNLATEEMQLKLPNPADPLTFTKCKLNFRERQQNAQIYQLHKDLLALKKNDAVFRNANVNIDGAVLNEHAFLLRFFGSDEEQRVLLINFGVDCSCVPAPEPLLAPPERMHWEVLWSSESPEYGGQGTTPFEFATCKMMGHSALILVAKSASEEAK